MIEFSFYRESKNATVRKTNTPAHPHGFLFKEDRGRGLEREYGVPPRLKYW
jgi:hypothetical protein